MGRKRKDEKKVDLKLKVEPLLLEELNNDGVNKSKLFSEKAREYLDEKESNKKS